MEGNRIAAVLAATDIFGVLDEASLLQLADRAQFRRVRKGQSIFVQDERGDALFVLAEGQVKIVVHSAQGEVVELARIWPPTVFGHVAPLDGQPRTAGAEAAEASLLIWIHRDDLMSLFRRNEAFQDSILRSLCGLVRRADQQAADRFFLQLKARIAKKLLELAPPEGSRDPELTQVELAKMVGATRQSVNGIIREFERRGFVQMADRHFRILNPRELQRLSQD